jgi:SAM-dependent methyltransferase
MMEEHGEDFAMHIPERLFEHRVPWADLQPEKFVDLSCALCGSRNYDVQASIVINWIEFHIVQCSNCSLVWRTPLPDDKFLDDLYSDAYYNVKEHSPDLEYQVGIADSHPADQESRRRKNHTEIQKWIDMGIIPKNTDGTAKKLLEIGGGRGYLQMAASTAGWNTLGLEISPHGIKEAINRGLVMLPTPLEKMCAQYLPYDRYFDLVVFFDFIEHVSDPGRILRMIRHLLVDSGTIVLRTPNATTIPKLHLIDHIWHFSENTLKALLEKERFKISKVQETGTFRAPDGNTIENITVFATKA